MNAPLPSVTIPVRRSAVGPSRGAFLCLPAMGVRASFYAPLAEALSARGFDMLVVDHRGTGTSEVRPRRGVSFGYREMVHEDVPRALAELRAHFPDRPTYLLGHSLGGQLASLFLGMNPTACDALVLVACGSVDFRGYPFPSSLRVLAGTQLAATIASGLGYFPGHKLGFGGRQPSGVIRDWARQCRTGRFQLEGSDEDYDAQMARVTLPVLALSIDGDTLSPFGATRKLCGKLARAEVTHERVAGTGKRNPHFAWVKRSDDVVQRISGFLGGAPGTAA